MKISDFYNHEAIIEGFGQARTRKVIQQLREVWPDFLGEKDEAIQKGGRSPYFYKHVNNYYAAWLLFILSNCKSHTRADVVNAVLRGRELKGKPRHDMEEMFIIWFGDLLSDPEAIKRDIRSVCIFFNADNMVSVFTEKHGAYAGENLLFHGNSPAYKIRHSACLEKDFLVEIASLVGAPNSEPEYTFGEYVEVNGERVQEIYLSEEDVIHEVVFGYERNNGTGEIIDKTGKVIAILKNNHLTLK